MSQLIRFLFGHEQAVFTNGRFGFDVRPGAVFLVLIVLLAGVFIYFIYLRPRVRLPKRTTAALIALRGLAPAARRPARRSARDDRSVGGGPSRAVPEARRRGRDRAASPATVRQARRSVRAARARRLVDQRRHADGAAEARGIAAGTVAIQRATRCSRHWGRTAAGRRSCSSR